jgi:hypothetical protein
VQAESRNSAVFEATLLGNPLSILLRKAVTFRIRSSLVSLVAFFAAVVVSSRSPIDGYTPKLLWKTFFPVANTLVQISFLDERG